MPNISRRVNSLTLECEKNTQMKQDTGLFSSYVQLLPKEFTDKRTLICGQLGLGSIQQLLSLRVWLQSSAISAQVNLKIFEPDLGTIVDFISQLASLTDKGTLHTAFIQDLINSNPVAISGCQRLIFDDGRFVIDLYLGDPLTSLQDMRLPVQTRSAAETCLLDLWSISLAPISRPFDINQTLLWQMAKISNNDAVLCSLDPNQNERLSQLCNHTGFSFIALDVVNDTVSIDSASSMSHSTLDSQISQQEREALRHAQAQTSLYTPLAHADSDTKADTFAIIGGGVASAHLALSLAQRHKKVRLFCNDGSLAQQASGNKQGAIYPLLTPDNGYLSHYFQQGYLFSRRRLQTLLSDGFTVSYDFCGVLQTGFDERSCARLDKIITAQTWDKQIAYAINSTESNEVAGIDIDKAGIFYPLGGWICPHEFTQAAFDKAAQLSDVSVEFNTDISTIEQIKGLWFLYNKSDDGAEQVKFGPFNTLILANGQGLTQFKQSEHLAATGFRGQVSHIPARNKLLKLNTVLCSHGYLTPQNNGFHCTGASYIKNPQHLEYSPNEQMENLHKIKQSYPDKTWTDDVDISDHRARVGVRMVTRDHAPMMGCAPNIDKILTNYQQHQHTKASIKYWQETPAPIHQGLFILGGLGSRGISSGPLAAEALAAQLCGEIIPLDGPTLDMLNPNRMWMRKLIKGKAL
ncbi:FAD-dependent 5-carboxymethylaminomethyl-2-thiouridine(34) oxidoreductase MnmC [Shewanella sp. D64]|uniref:FAD-dependent 5-carboxymethylaminomethyl-2-thiouridine(34) oxidoreductase MnmC n=1 Tax=unclassified Shewanella TaxID=196818 RepID=UPI0022BA62A3|nr:MULTISPECIES: FAD-dependent 5-carboxymethylaminomethyl-2-thiouridine(34) oxidoreductase MnmC [unclassified Shewanella]MEC4728678.1 FAD-dependent 5-carboxymethylaminomethyl-2-thiouridine(34) oxidoreductase MnmC [Shewanella sp. D64]MEC4736541.1 FAD-dependent 5-carboxymethylaminomethyl-2-thiouridine(34) oxidoreductase MnmC [Shewanella sp. E94]WBJ97407.1 FAD-dependent 5-carboxymethylaminomethyl-2-thiouridine(34) oxidoreductase MnmC [Shewanella sp. MTB7]